MAYTTDTIISCEGQVPTVESKNAEAFSMKAERAPNKATSITQVLTPGLFRRSTLVQLTGRAGIERPDTVCKCVFLNRELFACK
ncbi:hypothetical protein CDAR_561221 [Caerostris darwini]|uniref:Uncharacterized protein n=1 Tax=Caerostris darwini TaxID=1538125 RepID=A0AAV4PFC8_9ARAC|nr:hypothetical protein CDAR_561221 [Caerostris darwini]